MFLMGLRVWKLIVAQVSQSFNRTAVGEWVMAVRCQKTSEWLSAQLSSLSGCLRVTLAGGRKVLRGQKWLKGVQVVSSPTVVGVNSSDQCG